MAITSYQRATCDHCGTVAEVPERTQLLQDWVQLKISDAANSGLSGSDLRQHIVLCRKCRRDFAAWLNKAPVEATTA